MTGKRILIGLVGLAACLGGIRAETYSTSGFSKNPYQYQIDRHLTLLKSDDTADRASAIENLSFLRSFETADAIIPYLKDADATVRREAAMCLGWIGGSVSLKPLKRALDDSDWTVRQAAAIALENLSGIEFYFDGLAKPDERVKQLSKWRRSFYGLEETPEYSIWSSQSSFSEKEAALRSAGALGKTEQTGEVVSIIRPYVERQVTAKRHKELLYTPETPSIENRAEKNMVQAGIRALGRLGTDECRQLLIELLQNEQWAVYAAEALGDVGGEDAAAALISAFPDYAIGLNRAMHRTKDNKVVKKQHPSDAPRLSSIDRIPRTAHMILHSLARMDFQSLENIRALREVSPYILSNMPSPFDATMVYENEPWQLLAGYLLERAGVRQYAVDAVFEVCSLGSRKVPEDFEHREAFLKLAGDWLATGRSQDTPFAGTILMSCCREKADIPLLVKLLEHENGWIRIDAAKTLIFMRARKAIGPIMNLLASAKDDADYGFNADYYRFKSTKIGQGYDQYNDPSPRFKEAYIMALGKLKADQAGPLLVKMLNNDRNVIEIQYAAALALGEIASPHALEALQQAAANHPVKLVQVTAREIIWRNGLHLPAIEAAPKISALKQLPVPTGDPKELVFIKGPHDTKSQFQISKDFTSYSTTDSGPIWRMGNNIYKISTADPAGSLKQLTFFKDGFVADLEVSYDGKSLLFSRRGPDSDPWWHVYSMKADGSDIRQLTDGPYLDVHPNFMADGRILFSSSRIGTRDEYHGYPALGLSVMNADGSDLHVIGFNFGMDADPVVADDGKILFTRLELFYSRVKTEWNLLSVMPDGTTPMTLYGPERREFWGGIPGAGAMARPRHRVLRMSQPQTWSRQHVMVNSWKGPMLVGPGPYKEQVLRPDDQWAVTTPIKLSNSKMLVAAGKRGMTKSKKGKSVLDAMGTVDHGLYYMDARTGELTLIYNDPATSEFEARPLQPRRIPPALPGKPNTRDGSFTGKIYCNSVFNTQHRFVKEQGRYIRIVEGLPTVARHQTHMNKGIAWRNHGGATGRVLGTVPLAADGSFALEVPADHLFHLQVLDSDKRVLGNELLWQYARPGEDKSCVGCHQRPDASPTIRRSFPAAHRMAPVKCLPTGNEIRYRGKVWFKGYVPDEREERMRTVNSINLLGRQ